jgi:hypothetical protein
MLIDAKLTLCLPVRRNQARPNEFPWKEMNLDSIHLLVVLHCPAARLELAVDLLPGLFFGGRHEAILEEGGRPRTLSTPA